MNVVALNNTNYIHSVKKKQFHISHKAETRWPTFCKLHFEMHYLQSNCLNFDTFHLNL